MRILYGYSNCTDETYNRIMSERNASAMQPDQKYHSLVIRGLVENGAEVRCFSGLPINRAVTARKLVREQDEQQGSAHFHYITTINYPGIRHLMIFFGTLFGVLRSKKDKETYAVCDFLNTATAFAFVIACKLRRIKKTAIVTDLPDMFDSGGARKKISNFLLRRFDGYIFLTEYMNKAANPKNKPHLVIEGQCDSNVPPQSAGEPYEAESGKQVMIYAGNIQGKYGIGYLVEGFLLADLPNAELRVYGRGDFLDELLKLCESHPNLRYMGVKPNSEIVEEEQRAALLVNPRPTAPEYTKYSFPSKNMEYMASGTPLLTTKLPGMPEDYYPYIYLLEDETPEGAATALKAILSTPLSQRREKGRAAREFVLKNKSNLTQAKKIIDFLPILKNKRNEK